MKTVTWDVEATHLLNEESIDYNASPYRLKPEFEMHCIVVEDHNTGEIIAFYDGETYELDGDPWVENFGSYTYTLEDYEPVEYTHKQLSEFKDYIKKGSVKKFVAHNGINYDHLVCKLYLGMDYTVGPDTWCGRKVTIEDTMVTSKTLNPDRFGGHSLDNLGKFVKLNKINFRPHVPVADRFKEFAADMLFYCIRDVKVNTRVYHYLEKEKGDWDWEKPIRLEKAVAEIITRQEHRGFVFDTTLAEKAVEELDALMEERRLIVEPLLPPRPATKKFLKEHTPPAQQYLTEEIKLPAVKFKGNGEPSKTLLTFLENHGGSVDPETKVIEVYGKKYKAPFAVGDDGKPLSIVVKTKYSLSSSMQRFLDKHEGDADLDKMEVYLWGDTYEFPLPVEPLKTEMVATIDDTTHIKNWLVGLGWEPSEYKDKDITVKSGPGKEKRTEEELETAIERYVEETFSTDCNFTKHRLDHLDIKRQNPLTLKRKLLDISSKRSCKVLTNPSFTVGQDKELCPDLERISKHFPHAKSITEYLTYKHRRNSILGGGIEWDDAEEDAEKGYMANLREDGRIATPADTCGAATSRFKHRVVTNVPRITSLYGLIMRQLFGVDVGYVQVGYDFDSLEAGIESHYCWPFEGGDKAYCKSLTQEKPQDVHTRTAKSISEIIGKTFERGPAKAVKYGCLPVDNSQVLTKEGWKYYVDLEIGTEVLSYSTDLCHYEWKPITKLWFYEDAEVIKMENKWFSIESTRDHRWYGSKRRMIGSGKTAARYYDKGFFTTEDINSECNIQNASHYWNPESKITEAQAALVAWLLSDGYYKWSELDEVTSSSKGKRKGVIGSIGQDDKKFNKELLEVLEDSYVRYTHDKKGTFNVYRLKSEDLRNFLDAVVGSREQKHDVDWVSWILKLDQPTLHTFIKHFWYADGHKGKTESFQIAQNEGNIADAVMLAGNLAGYRVTHHRKGEGERCLVINFSEKCFTTGQRLKKTVSRSTDVFCLTNDNGTFVTRQNGTITLTGNCTYGAQAAKVAKTIGSDLETGNIVFNAFWDAADPLKRLKQHLTTRWKDEWGKRFIVGIDGRKVPTRAEHAILNSLFQSAGVICAKTAMVFHDRLLKKEGLDVDFFVDDWKNIEDFCQQLIAYHDEAQLEQPVTSFKFKSFKTKEAAQEARASLTEVWSEPFESKGKYFIAYSRAAELISVAVDKTTDYYKLNVPLSAGYIVGKNWADCH